MVQFYKVKYILSLIILSSIAFVPIDAISNESVKNEFFKAQKLENEKKHKDAIVAYKNLAVNFPTHRYAGESVFKIGVINDETLNNPAEAIKYYNQYIDKYNGRHVKRSRIRIKVLNRYKDVNPEIYRQYLFILSSHSSKNRKGSMDAMEKFIESNPTIPFLDEPLLWLGNEYKGFKRFSDNSANLEKAIKFYKRINDEFRNKRTRIAALKNLGDCYKMKGDNMTASDYYQVAYDKGGEYGKRLVGNYMFMAKKNLYYKFFFYGAIVIFIISIIALLKIVPMNEFSISGVKQGLKHSLFFLPGAVLFTVAAFILTDPSKSNNTGREPYLLLTIMTITLISIVFNGIVLDIDERKKVNFPLYGLFMGMLIISLNYIIFYGFNLLSSIVRLFF